MYDLERKDSEIPSDLITHYFSAKYQLIVESNLTTLAINQHSKLLSQLLKTTNHRCAVFITAYNPFSQPKTPEENLISHARLQLALKQYSNLIIDSVSSDPHEQWAAEYGFLALGVDLKTAKALGKQFKQNAIVWIGAEAIPRLILLR